jgi:hypothetical protein
MRHVSGRGGSCSSPWGVGVWVARVEEADGTGIGRAHCEVAFDDDLVGAGEAGGDGPQTYGLGG